MLEQVAVLRLAGSPAADLVVFHAVLAVRVAEGRRAVHALARRGAAASAAAQEGALAM
jgi:hypothetical protein